MKLVSVKQMRELDRQAIAAGIAGEQLMERAGRGAHREICRWLPTIEPHHRQRISVLVGKGNNGGDACVVARLLAQGKEFVPSLYSVCPINELDGDARRMAEKLPASVPIIVCPEHLPADALAADCVIVDGLLGTGFSGPPRPPYNYMIEQVNAARRPVAALDLPSGLNGDTGEAADGLAVRADLTVTMGLPKTGLFTAGGRPFCGRLRVVDIGLPDSAVAGAGSAGEVDFIGDIAPLLTRRPVDSHKNTFGRVLVVAGSPLYIGAPILTARGAQAGGAGLVTMAVPEGLWTDTAAPPLPAALIVRQLPSENNGCFGASCRKELEKLLGLADTVVFGPGVGTEPTTAETMKLILQKGRPTVIDADGLNLLAAHSDRFQGLLGNSILTPHPGEMTRLLRAFDLPSKPEGGRIEQAGSLARASQAMVVLKGAATVVANAQDEFWINSSGSSALASGGTGDVLAGLIAGLLAGGKKPADAARIAVFWHGLAAEINDLGETCFTADHLPKHLAKALKLITPFA